MTTTREYLFVATMDERDILRAFANIDKEVDTLAGKMDAGFKKMAGVSARNADVAAKKSAGAASKAAEEARKLEMQYVKLLAAELKLANSADKQTRALIDQAAAAARSSEAFGQAIGAIGGLDRADVELAHSVAEAKFRISELIAELDKEGVSVQNVLGEINQLEDVIRKLNASREESTLIMRDENATAKASADALKAAAREGAQGARLRSQAEKVAAQEQRNAQRVQIQALRQQQQAERQAASERRRIDREERAAERAREQAARRDAALARQKLANERAVAREFIRLVRTFPEARQELAKLAHEEGRFNVVLGKTQGELSQTQQRFNGIIGSYRQLQTEINKIVAAQGQVNLSFERGSFGNIGGGSGGLLGGMLGRGGALSLGIGAATAGFDLLKDAIVSVGREAKQLFEQIIQDSTRTALEFESVGTSLTAIFQGNAQVGAAVMERIRQESRRLGVDLNLIVRRLLPQVGSLEEALKFGELAAGLARLEPEQGEAGALIAINELITGDPVSLRKRFELPTDEIVRLQNEMGNVEGGLVGLERLLEQRGVDFESMEDTAGTAFGRIREYVTDLRNVLGQPILMELKDQFLETMEVLDRNEVEIEAVVTAVGKLIAHIIRLVGTRFNEFLRNIDGDAVVRVIETISNAATNLNETLDPLLSFKLDQGFADSFNELIRIGQGIGLVVGSVRDFLRTLDEALGPLDEFIFKLTPLGGVINSLSSSLDAWNERETEFSDGLVALGQIVTLVSSGIAFFSAKITTLLALTDQVAKGQITLADAFRQAHDAGQAAASEVINNFNDSLAEMEEVTVDVIEATGDLENQTDAMRQSALLYADAITALNHAMEEQATLQAQIAEAQATINEATKRANQEIDQRQMEMERNRINERLELEIDFQRERAELERKYLDELEEAERKHEQEIEDAKRDLDRKEEDAAKKRARAEIEIEKDLAKERINLAEKLARELARIQREFDRDARKAIKANDAIAFIEAKDRAEFESNEARIRNQEELDDAEDKAAEKRQALQDQLDQEVEDARIAYNRKVEDLKIALQRQLEEERIKFQISKREQAISEAERLEDLKRSYKLQLEEFNIWAEQKLAEVRQETADERIIIEEGIRRIEELESESYDSRLDALKGFLGARFGLILEDRERLQALEGDTAGSFGGGESGGSNDLGGSWGDDSSGGDSDNSFDPERAARLVKYSQESIDSLRAIALAAADVAGVPSFSKSGLNQADTMEELIDSIESLRQLFSLFREAMEAQGFARGGRYPGNRPIIVGDSTNGRPNPELVWPDGPGTVIPLDRLMMSMPASQGGARNYNYSRSTSVDVSMFNPAYVPPALLQLHERLAAASIERILGGT